jgi:hypothetical protein
VLLAGVPPLVHRGRILHGAPEIVSLRFQFLARGGALVSLDLQLKFLRLGLAWRLSQGGLVFTPIAICLLQPTVRIDHQSFLPLCFQDKLRPFLEKRITHYLIKICLRRNYVVCIYSQQILSFSHRGDFIRVFSVNRIYLINPIFQLDVSRFLGFNYFGSRLQRRFVSHGQSLFVLSEKGLTVYYSRAYSIHFYLRSIFLLGYVELSRDRVILLRSTFEIV